jgi:drug/metabolite transporter (DMT)-like permease
MSLNAILFCASTLIWGSTWYVITFQLGPVDPSVSIAYRFALAGGLILGWRLLRGQSCRLPRPLWGWVAAMGFFNFSLNYMLVYAATGHLPSGLVAVAGSVLSLMNVLNARLFLGQPLRWQVCLGGIMGVMGVLLLFSPEIDLAAHASTLGPSKAAVLGGAVTGFFLMMASNYSASLGNMVVSRLKGGGHPLLLITGWSMLLGAACTALVALFKGASFIILWTGPYLLSLLYLSLFGSIAAFLCYFTLLGRIGPDRSGYVAIMTPVIALLISTFLEDYHWTPAGVAGLAFAILGNVLVMARPERLARLPWFGRGRGAA